MLTLRRALGLRLSVWYATVFILSTVVLVGVTYALLAAALAQRDHDIIRATLREYASRYELGGLPALERAVELEQRTGDQERLFVRIVGRNAAATFMRTPQEWGAFALEELGDGSGLTDWSGTIAARCSKSRRRLGRQHLQVGKSNGSASPSCGSSSDRRPGSIAALVVGVWRPGADDHRQPIYDLIDVVQGIIRTGRTDTRVPVRKTDGDAVDELSALFNTMLDRINALIAAMGESLDNVAHDLRTPLARLRGIAERALQADDHARKQYPTRGPVD
jgi:signal transduction histidine kinase